MNDQLTNAHLLKQAAKEYGTPLYCYDFDKIKANFKSLKQAFRARKSMICYALKANSNLSLIQELSSVQSGADCVSIGEVKRALLAQIPRYKIIFSGVGKQDKEIKEAIELGILFLNVESQAELLKIEQIAKDCNQQARISIRVNPDIDAKTHPYISTGLQENKFGVDIEEAKGLYLHAKQSAYLNPIGIHFHIGSQLTELEPIAKSAQKIASLAKSLLHLQIDLKFFDIGGGIGICYDKEPTITPYDYAQAILDALKGLDLTIICEPGRYLVGKAGVFLTTVIYEKKTPKKHFLIVDGGMNDLLRPSLYQAYHQVIPLKSQLGPKQCYDIVGPICESGDWLAKAVTLPQIKANDLLAFMNAGAYGFSMSSNYNTRSRCAEVAIQNNRIRLIRQRESFEHLIALEKDFLINTPKEEAWTFNI